MPQYTKLFNSIVTSTIWSEEMPTKVLWITMLALADKNGEIHASVPGLARLAGISIAQTEEAIDKFLSPDPYSRTSDEEGRRVEVIDGGWMLINHEKYRRMASDADRKEKAAERQRRHRNKRLRNAPVTLVSHQNSQAEAEAEAEAEANTHPKRERENISRSTLANLEECVKNLRPNEWKLPFDANEREALCQAEETLSALEKEDWRVLRSYLTEYKKPQGEPGYQPTSRIRFIQAASDVWGYALNWHTKRVARQQANAHLRPKPNAQPTEEDQKALEEFLNKKIRHANH